MTTHFVHTHGPDEGEGINCSERVMGDGRLVGACQPGLWAAASVPPKA